MKVLIVGLGSIAKKHIYALRQLEPHVELYALRSGHSNASESGVTDIFSETVIPEDIDFIIVSNPTSKHFDTIKQMIAFNVPLFIEKPPLASLSGVDDLLASLLESQIMTYSAFNLRFHPVIKRLKTEIEIKKPLEISIYCGSYLPEWRPDQDYRNNYSAHKALGGGVHLDLIHELDYTTYLMGFPEKVESYFSKKSGLDIDSVDIAHYMLEYKNTSVFITLNYYRPQAKRQIECVWDDKIWNVDLIKGTITSSSDEIIFETDFTIADSYVYQMKYFLECYNSGKLPMNSFEEAIGVLKVGLNEQKEVA